MEQYIEQSENFEPSRDTRYRWLRIRKSPIEFAIATSYHFIIPGLINYNQKYRRDLVLFLAAIGLELWGLGNIYLAGKDSPLIVIGVPIAFLLDITSAICAHWFAGTKCFNENRIFLAELNGKTTVANGAKNENNGKVKFMRQFFNAIIIIVCLLKIGVFYGLNNGFDLLTFGICVSYFLVALIHIYITGYFIAEAFDFRPRLNSERSDHEKEANNGRKHQDFTITNFRENYVFLCSKKLKPCSHGKQQLVFIRNDNGKFKHGFKTYGVFQDGELSVIISAQDDENKKLVAFHGISHQLQIIQEAGLSRQGAAINPEENDFQQNGEKPPSNDSDFSEVNIEEIVNSKFKK